MTKGSEPGRRQAGPLRVLWVLGPLWCVFLWVRHADAPLRSGMGDLASYEPTKYAWNHVRYGLAVTKGRQIRNLEETTPDEFVVYTSHPGAVALGAALCFAAAGAPEPAAGRIGPAVAMLAAFCLLFLLARSTAGARTAPFGVVLFGLFPITAVHGVNLTYQPFMIASMLLTLVLYGRGHRRWAVASLLAGGLVDFAALYPAPFMAGHALLRAGSERRRAVSFAAASLLACAAALGTHVAFLAVVVGDLTGGSGRSWHEYIGEALGGGAVAFTLAEFLARQGSYLVESFTVPGIVLAAVGLARFARRLSMEEWTLLAIGILEVVIFRAHAHLHDFWWQYASPFFALAGGRALAWLNAPSPALSSVGARVFAGCGWALLAGVAALGIPRAWSSWRARDDPEVRRTADHLVAAADPREVVFLDQPPGWSVEVFRHRLVGNSTFLEPKDFEEAIRRLGGDFLALTRPIAVWHPEDRMESGLLAALADRFPASPSRVHATSSRGDRTYARIEIGSVLRDPRRSAFLSRACAPAELERLTMLAKRFLILSALRPGESVAVLDGLKEPAARHRHRGLMSHADPPVRQAGSWALFAAAWPGTPHADELDRLCAGRSSEERTLPLPEGEVVIRFYRLSE